MMDAIDKMYDTPAIYQAVHDFLDNYLLGLPEDPSHKVALSQIPGLYECFHKHEYQCSMVLVDLERYLSSGPIQKKKLLVKTRGLSGAGAENASITWRAPGVYINIFSKPHIYYQLEYRSETEKGFLDGHFCDDAAACSFSMADMYQKCTGRDLHAEPGDFVAKVSLMRKLLIVLGCYPYKNLDAVTYSLALDFLEELKGTDIRREALKHTLVTGGRTHVVLDLFFKGDDDQEIAFIARNIPESAHKALEDYLEKNDCAAARFFHSEHTIRNQYADFRFKPTLENVAAASEFMRREFLLKPASELDFPRWLKWYLKLASGAHDSTGECAELLALLARRADFDGERLFATIKPRLTKLYFDRYLVLRGSKLASGAGERDMIPLICTFFVQK